METESTESQSSSSRMVRSLEVCFRMNSISYGSFLSVESIAHPEQLPGHLVMVSARSWMFFAWSVSSVCFLISFFSLVAVDFVIAENNVGCAEYA